MQELMPINIVIADRSYRIKIDPNDEQDVRAKLKTINDKIIEFKTQFAGKDIQDYIAMVLLWYATQPGELGNSPMGGNQLAETLKKMEQQLDRVL
ncbi:MAG: cell division protein ZapA [Bacteroidetes bacterium]|nr:cell division protein ZapA [Bacteroidota bacterium]